MPEHRILVVEDEFAIRLVIAEMLALDGFEVLEAQHGDEAIRLLAQVDAPHLIVTDVSMPGSADGNRVAVAAKQRYPGIPVIYATGRPDSVTNRLHANDAVIARPICEQTLIATVRRLLGQ